MRSTIAFSILSVALLVRPLSAGDWPQFRGPDGLGTSQDRGLPDSWNASTNIAWRTELPGPGRSSPITVNDRICVTSYSGYAVDSRSPGDPKELRRHLLCLDRATGKIMWDREIPARLPEFDYTGQLMQHGYASSTPVADADRVYVFFGKSGVFAFDHDGNQLWHTDVGDGTHNWGSATSPILYKNLVIVNAAVESGSLVALDRETGKRVWHAGGIRRCWGTPGIVSLGDGKHELVISAQKQLFGFDPDTGTKLWWCDGIDDYVCPSVVIRGDLIFSIGARRGAAVAVRAGGRGDVTESHRIWQQSVGSNVPSPVLHGEHLYWLSNQGVAHCVKADSGEVVYRERLGGAGTVYASAIAADDKLYFVTRERGTFVVAAKPEFKQLAHNQIDSDSSIFDATPAVSNGQLLLRSDKYLYCIGAK